MPWQFFSLSAIVSNTLEETIDKAVMLGSEELDIVAAAWIRNMIVFAIALVVSVVLTQSIPGIIVAAPLIWWGFVYAAQAISYTWILKHIEITAASVTFALLPLIFLPIDLFVKHDSLSPLQILGIIILVIGGIIFFVRKDLRETMSRQQALFLIDVFFFDAIVIGSEGYIFKNYYATESLAPSSFLVSGMFFMCVFLTIAFAAWALYKGSTLKMKGAIAYARGSSVAKWADYGNIFFTLQALTVASVSQVSAMKVLHPLVLLVITVIVQQRLGVELREVFTRDTIIQKFVGICCIVVGSFLIT